MDILRVVESPRTDGPTILPLRGFSSGRRAPRMREYLEIAASTGVELRPLDGDRVTIGRHAGNDIVLAADDSASRLHAVLERLGPGWWLRDLGSRNGTFVNGTRVSEGRTLQHGDELRIGSTRLVYRISRPSEDDQAVTLAREAAPPLTPRERQVFGLLVRGKLNKQIAHELGTTERTVKAHRQQVMEKIKVHSFAELVTLAERLGLLN